MKIKHYEMSSNMLYIPC